MRELKFRMWDTFNNDWIGAVLDATTIHVNDWFRRKNTVFQQYTGLKDKNGKEIYIGDIVEWEFGDRKRVLVRWTDEHHDFHPAIIHHDSWTQGGAFEVIGNIYENPELLKQ